jgi:transcriptional regulator GlxA family with amidase domain
MRAARLVAETGGRISVRALAAKLGLGERRLQQLFALHVGLSPRAWGRLARLQGCLRLLRERPGSGWAETALEAGYYDQAHLANEFRALCGLTPSSFLERTTSGSSKTTR